MYSSNTLPFSYTIYNTPLFALFILYLPFLAEKPSQNSTISAPSILTKPLAHVIIILVFTDVQMQSIIQQLL